MATLFNTKISQTYEGLLKTIDNGVITATLKELTDGSGNQSGLFLNTAGDFKVTSILEWGSLKDTGTGVTITQFVTAANGIENFNNDTTLPTSAAVKLYVDTKFSQTDTLTEVLGFGNTTSGKDIAVSANDDITFTDTSKARFGTGLEFEIFQDTADSRITTSSNLYIQTPIFRVQKTGGESMIQAFTDGAVQLFFNGVKKIETTLLGSTVTGDLLVTGSITGAGGSFLPLAGGTMTGNTIHNDNVKSIYGTASDGLEIVHDGGNSRIKDTGTGSLVLSSSSFFIQNGSGNLISGSAGGTVELTFNGASKLTTTNTGVSVTGALSTTTNVLVGANATFVDNGKALFGNSNDLSIYHDGSQSYIDNTASNFNLRTTGSGIFFKNIAGGGNEHYAKFLSDGAVELYYNAVKRLETVTDGAKVSGNLEVTGTITGAGGSFLPLTGGIMTGGTIHNDNVKSLYGTSGDFEIFYDGTNALLDNYNGSLRVRGNTIRLESHSLINNFLIATQSQGVQLFFNDVQKFVTSNTGISVTGNGAFTTGVSVPDSAVVSLGSQDDLQLFHTGSSGFIKNITGDLFIDQAAGTQSINFRTSNNSPLDTTALIINRSGDLITGKDVTIAGDLTVNGTTTTVNSQTLSVVDPLISLATANAANSLDIGFYGKYNDGTARYLGLYNDASDSNKFKLFKNTTVEPTTVVSQAGGYQAADLVVAGLEGSSVVSTGSVIAASGNSGQITLSANSIGSTNNLILSTGSGGSNIEMYNTEMYFDANTHFFRSANAASTYLSINSTSASFAGDLSSVGTLTLKSDSTYFRIKRANNTDVGYITDSGTWGDSGADFAIGASSSNLKFYTNNSSTVKLTLDASGNASFVGNLTAARGFFNAGATNVVATFTSTDATSTLQCIDSGGNVEFGASGNNFVVQPAGGVAQLTVGATSSTFKGDVIVHPTGAAGYVKLSGDGNGAIYTSNGDMQFFTNNAAYATQFYSANKGSTLLTILDNGNSTLNGSLTINHNSGDTLILTKTTTEPSMRFQGDTNKDFCLTISGDDFTITQNDGVTDILALDHDTKNATFAGSITAAGAVFTGNTETRGTIRTTNTSDNSYFSLFGNDGSLTLDTYGTGAGIKLKILGTTKFNIANDGSVGVGMTPVSNVFFSLNQTTNNTSLGFFNTGTNAANRNWVVGSNDQVFGDFAIKTSTAIGGNPVTAGVSRLYISPTGNVGIGVPSAPTAKLEVRNDVAASTDLDPTAIKLYNNSDGGSAIEFSNGVAAKSKLSFGVEGTGGATDESFLGFSTGANAAISERMRITSAGKVGIGNEQPQDTLQVYSAVNTGITISSTAGYLADGGARLTFRGGNSEELSGIKGSYEISNQGNYGDLRLLTRTSDAKGLETKMRIRANGNISKVSKDQTTELGIQGSLNLTHPGSSGTFTRSFNPVLLFDHSQAGGMVRFEASGWQTLVNCGYIFYRNGGGSGTLTNAYYVPSAQQNISSGVGEITVSISSSVDNQIDVLFSGWHTNGHAFTAVVTPMV